MRGLQLSSLAHRVTDVVARLGTPAAREVPVAALDLPPDVPAHAAARARLALTPAAQERFDLLVERATTAAATDEPVPADVLGRALAASRSLGAVTDLVDAWPRSGAGRRAAADPLGALARSGAQHSATTCGPAVLTMLGAIGDPFLAWWLATGEVVGPVPELAGADPVRLAQVPPTVRAAALHRVWHARLVRGALGPADWPRRFGSPPDALARAARFLEVRFRAQPADDTDPRHQLALLDAVRDAVGRGVPVPLYAGGDTSRGVTTAVPRHVVLAVGADDDALEIYDPAGGAVRTVDREALATGVGVGRALGGWPHLAWVVLPRPSSY